MLIFTFCPSRDLLAQLTAYFDYSGWGYSCRESKYMGWVLLIETESKLLYFLRNILSGEINIVFFYSGQCYWSWTDQAQCWAAIGLERATKWHVFEMCFDVGTWASHSCCTLFTSNWLQMSITKYYISLSLKILATDIVCLDQSRIYQNYIRC